MLHISDMVHFYMLITSLWLSQHACSIRSKRLVPKHRELLAQWCSSAFGFIFLCFFNNLESSFWSTVKKLFPSSILNAFSSYCNRYYVKYEAWFYFKRKLLAYKAKHRYGHTTGNMQVVLLKEYLASALLPSVCFFVHNCSKLIACHFIINSQHISVKLE